MNFETAQPLLTVKEASAYLKLHPNTIYRWTSQGRIPFIRVNGLTRLNQRELNKYLNQESNFKSALPSPLPFPVQLLASHARIGLKGEGALGKKSSRRLNLNWGAVYVRKTKQGRERWCLDYRDARGKRIQKVVRNASNRQDAVIALQAAVQSVFNAQHNIKPALLPVFFGELAAQYLERYAQTNKRSWKTDRSYLKGMTDYFGNVMLSEITSLQVEGFKAERLKQGVKPSTVNRCLAILRKMFNLAVEWGYIQDQQKPKFRLFSEKDTQKERTLTQDEEVRLFQASADHLKPILKVALHTGMRLGEILSLRWEQVDLRKAQIRVEKTKSGKIRFIPINSTLLQELKALEANSGYLFSTSEAGKEKPLTTVRTAFKAACRRAGIKGLRFHDLRHTFASRLIERGADIITVKELLGHSSVKITERYTHSQDGQKRFAASLLNEPAGPPEAANLLRICDAESGKKSRTAESSSFSVN